MRYSIGRFGCLRFTVLSTVRRTRRFRVAIFGWGMRAVFWPVRVLVQRRELRLVQFGVG